MKYFLFIFFAFLGLSQHPDFEVIKATFERCSKNVEHSYTNTKLDYKFIIIARQSSDKLKIDKLWIGKDYYLISPSKKLSLTSGDGFAKNDTIYFFVSNYTKIDKQGKIVSSVDNIKQETPPYKYDGDALIGFKIDNQRKYKVITKIKEIKHSFAP